MSNNRHTDECDFWCTKRHWTARNIRLKLLWRFRAFLRLRYRIGWWPR